MKNVNHTKTQSLFISETFYNYQTLCLKHSKYFLKMFHVKHFTSK